MRKEESRIFICTVEVRLFGQSIERQLFILYATKIYRYVKRVIEIIIISKFNYATIYIWWLSYGVHTLIYLAIAMYRKT